MRFLAAALIALPLLLFLFLHPDEPWAPTAAGERFAVSTTHPLATRVGMDVLRRGGTAADAAVAVSFALAVVYPEAGNLGGGFFAVGHQEAKGETWMLDARETAPAAVTRDTYRNLPSGASLRGPWAAGVPGTPAGLAALHARYGKLSWRELVAPAERLAREGFPLTARATDRLLGMKRRLAADPETRRIFYTPEPATGGTLRQPDLAATLRRLTGDPRDFYDGETAALIVADMQTEGGPITAADLDAYAPQWREPVRCRYRDFDLVSSAPPSSGGTILCQTAQILQPFEMEALDPRGARFLHLTMQAWGFAFADRAALGDPDVVDLSGLGHLITEEYGLLLADRIDPGAPLPFTAPALRPESMQTTHFSVVDGEGNAVSLTTTLNGAFGNGHVVRGAGFLLNNEMDDFNTRPGEPNLYGLVQGEANVPGPGKRMLSSMSPTLVFRDGRLVMVLGTPGGSTIPTTVWQIFSRQVDAGWSLDRAVAFPRMHYQGVPDAVMAEPAWMGTDTAKLLERIGYTVMTRGRRYGDVNAIRRAADGEGWIAVADPRGDGYPLAE